MKEIFTGVIGALVGGLILFMVTQGVRLTRKSWKRRRLELAEERDAWTTGDTSARQEITNEYLFTILKWMLVATVVQTIYSSMFPHLLFSAGFTHLGVVKALQTVVQSVACVIYLIALGWAARYLRLKRRRP